MYMKNVIGFCISIQLKLEISDKKIFKSSFEVEACIHIIQLVHFPYTLSVITLYIITKSCFSLLDINICMFSLFR